MDSYFPRHHSGCRGSPDAELGGISDRVDLVVPADVLYLFHKGFGVIREHTIDSQHPPPVTQWRCARPRLTRRRYRTYHLA